MGLRTSLVNINKKFKPPIINRNPVLKPMVHHIPVEPVVAKVNIVGFSLDNYQTINPQGHTIICRLGETCDGLQFYPNTSKLVLNSQQQSQLVNNFDQFIPELANDLGVSHQAAVDTTVDFFSNHDVMVEPIGIQGRVYNAMKGIQNCVPMIYTSKAVAVAKTTGMTGLNIISQAPLTFVGATYIGAMFFSYMGAVAGHNPVGLTFNGTSYILSRPMRGLELVTNGLIFYQYPSLLDYQ